MNFDFICRLCGENKKTLKPIFVQDGDQTKNELLDKIFYLCSLEPFQGDGLPENICKPCQRRLNDACDFKKQISTTEQNFKSILAEGLNIKTELEVDDWEQLGENSFNKDNDEEKKEENYHEDKEVLSDDEAQDESYNPENDEEFEEDIVMEYDSCDDEFIKKTIKKEKIRQEEEDGDVDGFNEDTVTVDELEKKAIKRQNAAIRRNEKTKQQTKKKRICPECGMLVSNGAFTDHMLMKHYEGEPQFSCDVCGLKVKTKRLLWHHKKMKHTERDKINCDQCGLIFATKNNFRKHYNTIHLGIKNYKCPFEGCGKLFGRPSAFFKHKISHTGERNFICKICSKALSNPETLKQHMRQHNDERPYICKDCGEAFKQNVTLKLHIKRKHLGISAQMEKEMNNLI